MTRAVERLTVAPARNPGVRVPKPRSPQLRGRSGLSAAARPQLRGRSGLSAARGRAPRSSEVRQTASSRHPDSTPNMWPAGFNPAGRSGHRRCRAQDGGRSADATRRRHVGRSTTVWLIGDGSTIVWLAAVQIDHRLRTWGADRPPSSGDPPAADVDTDRRSLAAIDRAGEPLGDHRRVHLRRPGTSTPPAVPVRRRDHHRSRPGRERAHPSIRRRPHRSGADGAARDDSRRPGAGCAGLRRQPDGPRRPRRVPQRHAGRRSGDAAAAGR